MSPWQIFAVSLGGWRRGLQRSDGPEPGGSRAGWSDRGEAGREQLPEVPVPVCVPGCSATCDTLPSRGLGWPSPRQLGVRAARCHGSSGECGVEGMCRPGLLGGVRAAEAVCGQGRDPAALPSGARLSSGTHRDSFSGRLRRFCVYVRCLMGWGKKITRKDETNMYEKREGYEVARILIPERRGGTAHTRGAEEGRWRGRPELLGWF